MKPYADVVLKPYVTSTDVIFRREAHFRNSDIEDITSHREDKTRQDKTRQEDRDSSDVQVPKVSFSSGFVVFCCLLVSFGVFWCLLVSFVLFWCLFSRLLLSFWSLVFCCPLLSFVVFRCWSPLPMRVPRPMSVCMPVCDHAIRRTPRAPRRMS